MASPQSVSADALPDGDTAELDIYAAEFAKLVSRYSPHRGETPSDWLSRLPNEAYLYYHRGTSTFGREARTPIERRGRLYLIHTALVFMWMSWGKSTARQRFQSKAHKGTRRAASLITLEHYKRGGVFADYNTFDWFFQPVDEWTVTLISAAVRTDRISDPELKDSVEDAPLARCTVGTVATLRSAGALPPRKNLVLD
jgi:hypothetical protein